MSTRPFAFFRAGGVDQVHFRSGDDLIAIGALPEQLWVALACPVKGLGIDERTLQLLDGDGDGRLRRPDLVDTAQWLGEVLKEPELLLAGADALPLSAIDASALQGQELLEAARLMLRSLGKAEAVSLTVADAMEATTAFQKQPLNGDGLLTAASGGSEALGAELADIISVAGSPGPDGTPSLTEAQLASFHEAAAAFLAWRARGEAPEVQPLGPGTAAAVAAVDAVAAKVDDYFTRCAFAALDPRAAAPLGGEPGLYAAMAGQLLSASADAVKALPLAPIGPGRALDLRAGVNPAWAGALEAAMAAVAPVLRDAHALTAEDWRALSARLAPHRAWRDSKEGAAVETLAPARLEALTAPGARARIEALFAEERKLAPTAAAFRTVEKLVRCCRDFHRLALNFVSFRDLYEGKRPAAFQVGTLYIDRRACRLTLAVDDAGRHASMGPSSRCHLLYCDARRTVEGVVQARSIVAAVTGGDAENLVAGRNGLFIDRDGQPWDATVTRVVENPISVREAFWTPYRRLGRFIEGFISERAAAADASGAKQLTDRVTALAQPKAPGPGAVPAKLDVGVVAALGVAVGGITAALGALLQAFFGLGLWMPLGVLGGVLLISGPSMLIAFLKLRGRNIGPLLDANGWAVNANARINIPFGESLTRLGVKPPGSTTDLADPFQEKRTPWRLYLALLVLLALAAAYWTGGLDPLVPQRFRRLPAPAAVEAVDAGV